MDLQSTDLALHLGSVRHILSGFQYLRLDIILKRTVYNNSCGAQQLGWHNEKNMFLSLDLVPSWLYIKGT